MARAFGGRARFSYFHGDRLSRRFRLCIKALAPRVGLTAAVLPDAIAPALPLTCKICIGVTISDALPRLLLRRSESLLTQRGMHLVVNPFCLRLRRGLELRMRHHRRTLTHMPIERFSGGDQEPVWNSGEEWLCNARGPGHSEARAPRARTSEIIDDGSSGSPPVLERY